jgi:hypothetical protein
MRVMKALCAERDIFAASRDEHLPPVIPTNVETMDALGQ